VAHAPWSHGWYTGSYKGLKTFRVSLMLQFPVNFSTLRLLFIIQNEIKSWKSLVHAQNRRSFAAYVTTLFHCEPKNKICGHKQFPEARKKKKSNKNISQTYKSYYFNPWHVKFTTSVLYMCIQKLYKYTGWSKSLCAPDDYRTKNTQKHSILNTFNHLTW
jgi:hypothetical protein